jgi:hypothetical protein
MVFYFDEAGLFSDDLLIPNPGFLISGPSNSAKQGGLVAGATMDDQVIRDLLCHVAEAGQVITLDRAE